jgi:hypothetical protein
LGCSDAARPDRRISVVVDEAGDPAQTRIGYLTHRYAPNGDFTIGQSSTLAVDTNASAPVSTDVTTVSWQVRAMDAEATARRLRVEPHVVSVELTN